MKNFKELCGKAKTKLSKVGYSAIATAGTIAVMTPMVAAADDLANKINGAVDTIKGVVIAIFLPIALVAFIVAGIIRMVSKNPRTAEEATEWMKRILITSAIVGGATILLNFASGLIGGTGLDALK